MPLEKTGDWDVVGLLTANLSKEMKASQRIALKKVALKMEGTAKKHMARQDLGWEALKPSTIAQKARKGLSNKILIATSTYFQSIKSWVKGNTAYAGVNRKTTTEDGKVLADIAKIHEFSKTTKRPLWKPTFVDAMRWYNKNPVHLVEFKKRLLKYKGSGKPTKEVPKGGLGLA